MRVCLGEFGESAILDVLGSFTVQAEVILPLARRADIPLADVIEAVLVGCRAELARRWRGESQVAAIHLPELAPFWAGEARNVFDGLAKAFETRLRSAEPVCHPFIRESARLARELSLAALASSATVVVN